jgi:excisionase family DNA binding protein
LLAKTAAYSVRSGWHKGCALCRETLRPQQTMLKPNNVHAFLTLDEAAAMLQVSKRTLQRLVQRREMPALKIVGQWRIPQDRFMKWVEERMVSESELHKAEGEERAGRKNVLRSFNQFPD